MQVTDQLASKLLDIINQVQAGIVAHAPDALNIVLQTVRIDAISRFIYASCLLLGVVILSGIFVRINKKKDKDGDMREGVAVYCVLAGFFGTVFIILAFSQLFNVWQYVAIANPKLYLAHQIVQKVMQ
jgi:hypothetical protein